MKRLYEDYAYGPEPIKNCFWDRSVPLPQLPPLSGSRKVDVAVIGAGYTGLSAALHLAQDGAEVAVVDAETPFWGASGRNGGFCCLGGAKASDKTLVTRFGNAGKTAFRRSEKAAVTCVADLITRHGIKADCHSNGETVLAHRPQDMTALRRQAIDIKIDYGVEAHYISAPHLSAHGMTGPFHGAMTIPIGFALNPRKYANGLLCAAQSAGAKVFANSPVTKLQKKSGVQPEHTARPNHRRKSHFCHQRLFFGSFARLDARPVFACSIKYYCDPAADSQRAGGTGLDQPSNGV